MLVTRKQLADHLAAYQTVADNPEYGGTLVDWVWDWLFDEMGSEAPTTGPNARWVQLRKDY